MSPINDSSISLCHLVKSFDLNFVECLELAYNEIKDRKGYLNEAGDFIKEVK